MKVALHSLDRISLVHPPASSPRHRIAVREFARGLTQIGYMGRVFTGELPGPPPSGSELRVLLIVTDGNTESHTLTTSLVEQGSTLLTVDASSDSALLNAVFDFLEHQGAYFGVDGDLYPIDRPDSLILPDPAQPWSGRPRLATRGLVPWPDFLNCISAYNAEDFRAYLEAMLRMRLNTLGIHVYGQGNKWAESFLSFEYGGVGHAAFTDTTATDRWGYLPQRTSRYGMGAAQYFDDDVFGGDATRRARSPWEAAELAQTLWREAFAYAEQLGIRTGIGFEPYRVPDEILRAAPPETRLETPHFIPHSRREVTVPRIDPESRTARYILETRLAQLLEAYPSVSHVYLWEDELTNWASQGAEVELPMTPFIQAHDFLRRHAAQKRLVLAGWGGVVRNFPSFHRALPEDVIFAALSDQFGWDPIHRAFGDLGDRERWPILWIEDDPSMWFPQVHAHRFAKDIALAEQYGCQGMLGIHWRHRIIDPVAGYMARRFWDAALQPQVHYQAYARTQATDIRIKGFADWLEDVDSRRRFLSTWTGELRSDGHAKHQEFSGDYGEAFLIEKDYDITDEFVATQADTIASLKSLLDTAVSPIERERLGYWYGQSNFLDHYARAWQIGRKLHHLIMRQQAVKKGGDRVGAAKTVHTQGVPLWITLLGYVRDAVLSFQHTVATRNDLGMLASIHNKLVRIATSRLAESLKEFLDELPAEAEAARNCALAPDTPLEASVFVPTRPTRLLQDRPLLITAIAPGIREVAAIVLHWREVGSTSWHTVPMTHSGRRTYAVELALPDSTHNGIQYVVQAEFAGMPTPMVVSAPPEGTYLLTQ